MVSFCALSAMLDQRLVCVLGVSCCDNLAHEFVERLYPLLVTDSQQLSKTRIVTLHRKNPARNHHHTSQSRGGIATMPRHNTIVLGHDQRFKESVDPDRARQFDNGRVIETHRAIN